MNDSINICKISVSQRSRHHGEIGKPTGNSMRPHVLCVYYAPTMRQWDLFTLPLPISLSRGVGSLVFWTIWASRRNRQTDRELNEASCTMRLLCAYYAPMKFVYPACPVRSVFWGGGLVNVLEDLGITAESANRPGTQWGLVYYAPTISRLCANEICLPRPFQSFFSGGVSLMFWTIQTSRRNRQTNPDLNEASWRIGQSTRICQAAGDHAWIDPSQAPWIEL